MSVLVRALSAPTGSGEVAHVQASAMGDRPGGANVLARGSSGCVRVCVSECAIVNGSILLDVN